MSLQRGARERESERASESAQLNYLVRQSTLGVKVENVWSGSKSYPGVLDRFTLLIPYCLDYIKWDVLYNAEFPLCPPDVIFAPEDEHFHPFRLRSREGGNEMEGAKNSLSDWNHKDPTRLCALIQELRDEYTDYQRRRAGEVDDDRLTFEISTILSREGIEMHMSSGLDKPQEVKFAVPLVDMNINKVVHGCPWRHLQKIHLQVVYPVGKKYVSAASAPRLKLVSTPELKALFSVDDVKLPSWVDGMCMAEYLPHLEESLQGQIMEAVALIDIRRHFIEALAPVFGRPVEADPVFCRKATVLVASGVFTFLVSLIFCYVFFILDSDITLCCNKHELDTRVGRERGAVLQRWHNGGHFFR
ncbi:BRISC and BRCA1-A complex member 2 [Eucalyptus grandis]|uniref:BRISC and BRCA1-A complex member 2 n=1 Tax=Eucalyptus grandis TaxID=71139 RepID=UPI00192EE19F|nr:BRISC and BRCA1-A complex member 2 [Eucalyptus grandis]